MIKIQRFILVISACLLAHSARLDANESVSEDASNIWTYQEPAPFAAEKQRFRAGAEVGQQRQAGATRFALAKVSGNLGYDTGIDEAVERASFQELQTGDKPRMRTVKSYTGYDRYVGYRTWVFLLNDYEFNEARNLKFSLMNGGGLKFDLLRNTFWKFNVGVALLRRNQQSKNNLSAQDDMASYRVKFNVYHEKSEFFSIFNYQKSILKKAHHLWTSDSGIKVDFNPRFYAKLGYTYRFDSAPIDPKVAKWDIEEYTQLGCSF